MSLFDDENIEESMLRSCLLCKEKSIKEKKNSLFPKYILSIILGHKLHSKEEIESYIKKNKKGLIINNGRLDSALNTLINDHFIEINNDNIIIPEETEKRSKKLIEEENKKQQSLVDDIFNAVNTQFKKSISNTNQVKANIKNCINYYYTVCGHSFFELDNKKEFNSLTNLSEIAIENLPKSQTSREELANHIIYETGKVFKSPNPKQKEIIDGLAKIFITTQIMNIDPLLANFKGSIIRGKTFILDTDVVLNAITEKAEYSVLYKKMIDYLIKVGCKIYLPEDVIIEVYNHGEAARKMYSFVSHTIDLGDTVVKENIKNVFVEDYAKKRNEKPDIEWESYIGNYHNHRYGKKYVKDQVVSKLPQNIVYDLPQSSPNRIQINEEEKKLLKEKVFEATSNTEKGIRRDNEKNEDIANTDTYLYLYIKKLNEITNERDGTSNNETLLSNKYYILTNSTRVHTEAKALKLDAKVLCKPAALIAYLEEAGVDSEMSITDFFDNPFLVHIANLLWDDVKMFHEVGLDIKDKNLIAMKYELHDDIENFLTSETEDKHEVFHQKVTSKGYRFDEKIESLYNKNEKLEKMVAELEAELEERKKHEKINIEKNRKEENFKKYNELKNIVHGKGFGNRKKSH